MRVDLFDFELPFARIAQAPARPRDAARLLLVEEPLREALARDLPDLLAPGDLLVLNDTRVLPTRFFARRGGSAVEVTLVERIDGSAWWALARPGRRLRINDEVELSPGLLARVEAKDAAGRAALCFAIEGEALLAAIRAHGAMPLPPYIKRGQGGSRQDLADYQTCFARREGAVAAPTASLHLTPKLLERLGARGVETAFVTLHVGAGTFAPVKAEDTEQHVMHAEWFDLPEATALALRSARAQGGRIVAAGTTVLRALESAVEDDGEIRPRSGWTRLFVTPGHRFRTADLLLTNFHLPRSTLFMLVCAFAGTERMRGAYAHAIREGFRFYSYGDACLLKRADPA